MLSYHYQPEEVNRRVLRVIHLMLIAYVAPLWMQLLYMGETVDPQGMTHLGMVTIHPVTLTLLAANLWMPVYMLLLELIQSRVRNFWLYLGAQAAGIAIMYGALPNHDGRIPRLLVCVMFLIGAFYARIQEVHIGYPAIGWQAAGVLMVMTGEQLGLHDLRMAGYVTESLSAMLFVLYYNTCSLERALEHTKGAGGVPYDKVRQTNMGIMLLWVLLAVVLIVVLTITGVGDVLFDVLGAGTKWLLRQLVRLIGWIADILPQSEAYEKTAPTMELIQQGVGESADSNLVAILTMILEILTVICRLAAVIAVIYGVVYLCKWLYRSYIAAAPDERTHLTWRQARDQVVAADPMRTHRLSPLDPTPAARIRRAYVRLLKRGEGYRVLRQSMTPTEQMTVTVNIDNSNSPNQEELMRRIRLLYEKARYLPSQCTLQDVRSMRKAIQEIESHL